ncbi:MFS transporter [Streptomyces sp. NPDC001388]|uniref:MFS transporter n=1 Tax=Streptomyces sp. NPDC001388 TaxID=3364568 RepID=UPI0036A5411C
MSLTENRISPPRAPRLPAGRVAHPAAALALLVSSHFMLNLDSAIVEVALPTIKNSFGVGLSELSWVVNAYVLAFGGFLLLGGRLGDILGRRRTFTGGLVLFALASLLGGVATTPELVVVARAAQGLAAAVISPTALSLLVQIFPNGTPAERARRNKALGTLGAVAATGGSAGYFLGGVLTDTLGWEATFLVNVPIAAGAAVCAGRLLPRDEARAAHARLDLVSALTGCTGMTLLVYALLGAESAGIRTPRTVGFAALALVLLGLFVLRQRRSDDPLFPLRILKHPAVRGANAVAALINMAISPVIFFLSLYIQQVLAYSPFAAGIAILPIVVSITVASSLTGRLLDRHGPRAVTVTGLTLFAAGLVWLSQVSGDAYWAQVLGPECLIGFGGGLVFVTFTVCGTSGPDDQDSGAASGVLTTSQKIGSAAGLAVLTGIASVAPGGASAASGYGFAFLAAAVPVLLAVAASARWIPARPQQ